MVENQSANPWLLMTTSKMLEDFQNNGDATTDARKIFALYNKVLV